MNYGTTQELLEIVKELAPNSSISISCVNKDFRGLEYQSDLVTIDETNHVGFEVFENEIIAFYFSEHHHFEDYSSSPDDDEPKYADRMKEFLKDLFTCTIRHEKKFRGNVLISERHIFVYPDKTEECPAGVWVHGLLIRLVPFLRKRTECTSWKYDIQSGVFVEVK